MRVGIDVRKLGDGGIGEYIRETVTAVARLAPEVEIVAFGEASQREALPIPRLEWVEVRAGKYSLAEHWVLPAAARRSGIDLYHAPHYVLPFGIRSASVVTVHDLIHVLFPRSPIHSLYGRRMIASACRRAGRVIAVSETTARDLAARFAVAEEKLRVIPNGVAPRFRRLPENELVRELDRLGVRRPYILFVGNWLPHKNVETLVRAWVKLPEPRPELVLCGGGFDRAAEVWRAVEESGSPGGVRALGLVGEEALVALYGGAECFASTSLYEGFGLPLLEAFACGTPVLGPDAGAVPEVVGDAALLVPPRRVDMISSGLYRLLRDHELRKELTEKGLRRARRFSWEEAARKTLSVYKEATEATPIRP